MKRPNFSAPDIARDFTKVEGARIQILSAIDALSDGNVVVAITLAGAAEGMLPDLATKSAFRGLRDHPGVPPELREDWVSVLNIDRDWLKHQTPQLPSALTIDTGDAAFMIVRALSKLPPESWNERMEAFKTWYMGWHLTDVRSRKFPEFEDGE